MSISYTEPPADIFYSTYLNNRIKDIETLSERVAMSLGYPQINIEAHTRQVYDNIAQACELFTKFAGYTEEYLVFHSSLYTMHKGLYMPDLINFTPELSGQIVDEVTVTNSPISTTDIQILNDDRPIYSYTVSNTETGPVEYLLQFKSNRYHHATKFLITAIYNDITDEVDASVSEYSTTYTGEDQQVSFNVKTGGDVIELVINSQVAGTATVTIGDYKNTSTSSKLTTYSRGMDSLLGTHRKVMDVFAFEEGTTAGINTLFTIEQTLAQQTYFSYSMGKYGFDLVSWYVLKEWLSMREKLLTQKFYWKFNEREQRLFISPEPVRERNRAEFFAAIGTWLEKPVGDVMKEPWVHQYTLALTKISVARIRGKYQGTNLFGGGTPNYNDLLSEGLTEKKDLEASLMETGTPGFGDAAPPMFFVG